MSRGIQGAQGTAGATGAQGVRGKYRLSLFFASLALITSLGGNIIQLHNTKIETRDGKESHAALCVFASDLQKRIINGRLFVLAHPNGIAGITAKTINVSIANEQATLDALKTHLTC